MRFVCGCGTHCYLLVPYFFAYAWLCYLGFCVVLFLLLVSSGWSFFFSSPGLGRAWQAWMFVRLLRLCFVLFGLFWGLHLVRGWSGWLASLVLLLGDAFDVLSVCWAVLLFGFLLFSGCLCFCGVGKQAVLCRVGWCVVSADLFCACSCDWLFFCRRICLLFRWFGCAVLLCSACGVFAAVSAMVVLGRVVLVSPLVGDFFALVWHGGPGRFGALFLVWFLLAFKPDFWGRVLLLEGLRHSACRCCCGSWSDLVLDALIGYAL